MDQSITAILEEKSVKTTGYLTETRDRMKHPLPLLNHFLFPFLLFLSSSCFRLLLPLFFLLSFSC